MTTSDTPARTGSGTKAPASSSTGPVRSRRQGPPPVAPAAAWAGLTVAGALLHPGTRPTDPPTEVLSTLQAAPFTATLSAVLLIASAAPLAVWTATVHQRLQALGVRVAGPTIGLVGGILATTALAISGLTAWTAASVAPAEDAGVVHALNLASFSAGGPLFAVTVALLIAGFATPTLILRLVPRALSIAGLVVAGFGVAGLLVLLVPALGPVLPIARFGGLLWLVAFSVLLPRNRAEAREKARLISAHQMEDRDGAEHGDQQPRPTDSTREVRR